jgi:phosphoglycerate dehydrogenase-like enzyme
MAGVSRPAFFSDNMVLPEESKLPMEGKKQVAVGEVWLCGGQSNMVMPVSYASDGGADVFSADADIRFYADGKWVKVDANNYQKMPAVPYFLAKERNRLTGKVIGIVVVAQGGTGIEAWLPKEAMPDSEIGRKMKELSCAPEVIAAANLDRGEEMRPYGQHRLAKWGLGRAYPSELYQNHVFPLAGIPISGIIWYQGESNADSLAMAAEYDLWLKGLIGSWRKLFSNVPVMLVELPKYNSPTEENPKCWNVLRSSQKRCVDSSANIYWIPAYDLGDEKNIHPKKKRTMGERIAEFIQNKKLEQMTKVIVTDLEYNKAERIFQNADRFECIAAPSDEVGLAKSIWDEQAKYVIVGINKYAKDLYEAVPSGGVIARFGVGHDGIDKIQAKAKGIYCTNTPGVLDDSVAECAIGLILTAARHLATCAANNKNGVWKNRVGVELAGKTLAIIGCGNIGCKVAKIAKYGFGMKVNGFDVVKPKDMSVIGEFYPDFAAAVKNADFVSIHIPDIPSTKDFINADKLKMLKTSAVLLNTARGGVLDENAIYDAVKSGMIAGAALDVFKVEPYAPQNQEKDLRTLDNVIMTPHIGSSTVEACERMAKAALKNIELAVHGKINEMNLLN